MDAYARAREAEGSLTMADRILRHKFHTAFFQLKTLELNVQFTNVFENKPLKDLVLVEKHFFKDQILSEFEFKFPFCVPNSTNTWQYVYNLPDLSREQQQLMIDNPWDTKSDSFFFAEGKLIVHNKASYCYTDGVQ